MAARTSRPLPNIIQEFNKLGLGKLGLVRVGAPFSGQLKSEVIAALGTSDSLLELGRASRADLWKAYNNSDALLFPSFYEGFGLPVIEALACGIGVACSDRASLPEAGGDVVEYFDPDDFPAAANALGRALEDGGEGVRRRRQNHAAKFSWELHSEKLAEIYGS